MRRSWCNRNVISQKSTRNWAKSRILTVRTWKKCWPNLKMTLWLKSANSKDLTVKRKGSERCKSHKRKRHRNWRSSLHRRLSRLLNLMKRRRMLKKIWSRKRSNSIEKNSPLTNYKRPSTCWVIELRKWKQVSSLKSSRLSRLRNNWSTSSMCGKFRNGPWNKWRKKWSKRKKSWLKKTGRHVSGWNG